QSVGIWELSKRLVKINYGMSVNINRLFKKYSNRVLSLIIRYLSGQREVRTVEVNLKQLQQKQMTDGLLVGVRHLQRCDRSLRIFMSVQRLKGRARLVTPSSIVTDPVSPLKRHGIQLR